MPAAHGENVYSDDDEPPPLEIVVDEVDWDLPDLEVVSEEAAVEETTAAVEKLAVEEKVVKAVPVKEADQDIPCLEPVKVPVTEEPVVEETAAEQPAAEQPVAQEPTPQPELEQLTTPKSAESASTTPSTPLPLSKVTDINSVSSPKQVVVTKPKEASATKKKSRSQIKAEEMKHKGNDAIREGDYDKAIELYSKAIALDKVNLNREDGEGYLLYCNRAKAYLAKTPTNKHQYKWALKDAEMAIQIKPDFAKAHYRAAIAFEGLGQEEKAIEKFCKVGEFVPGDVSIAKKLSTLVHFKPDVAYMATILINPSYSHFTAFLDITSGYMCKLLSNKPEEYAKISTDLDSTVTKDESNFAEEVEVRQKTFAGEDGEKAAELLIKTDNKRLRHYGKKFQKIVSRHRSK